MHLLGARARPPRAKLVWHLHDYPAARRLTARLLASQAHRCDAMLANSESVAAEARQRFGTGVPVHAMYNSMDLERFSPAGPRADLDALAGLPPLGSGRNPRRARRHVRAMERARVFLDALARLRGVANVRGYIVGDSIYHTDASQYSRAAAAALRRTALGLGDAVGFTGKVDDVSGGAARARYRGAREHRAGAVRPRHRRSDGLRPPGRGQPSGRRRRDRAGRGGVSRAGQQR